MIAVREKEGAPVVFSVNAELVYIHISLLTSFTFRRRVTQVSDGVILIVANSRILARESPPLITTNVGMYELSAGSTNIRNHSIPMLGCISR